MGIDLNLIEFFIFVGITTNKVSSRIYRGETARRGTRKFQLFLVSSRTQRGIVETKEGGAILIKENFALTAAQVVTSTPFREPMEHIILSGGSVFR